MTPAAQRIAIAEACPEIIKFELGVWKWRHSNGTWHCCLWGDPLLDLNAMHEVEKTLGEKRIRSYAFTLAQVLDTTPTVDLDDQFLNIHATAAQRAHAFLRTLNLWRDDA